MTCSVDRAIQLRRELGKDFLLVGIKELNSASNHWAKLERTLT